MSRAILLTSDDWEGLFVDGKLVEEGHTINEGEPRIKCFNELSKKYNFKLNELIEQYVCNEDGEYLYEHGCFPELISELSGEYK